MAIHQPRLIEAHPRYPRIMQIEVCQHCGIRFTTNAPMLAAVEATS